MKDKDIKQIKVGGYSVPHVWTGSEAALTIHINLMQSNGEPITLTFEHLEGAVRFAAAVQEEVTRRVLMDLSNKQ